VDKTAQVRLHALIHALCLAICLRVVRRTHSQGYASQSKEFLPQIAGEDTISVRNQGQWHTMQFVDRIHESLGH
jgi:hypothetical protein